MAIERTLILVKPDGVRRGLVGEVVGRLERKGLGLVALELRTLSAEIAQEHYAEHAGKPFYAGLIEFITSGPLVALVAEGESAIRAARVLMGATNPTEAAPGSIRGDLATETSENIVHGSDSPESAAREIALFFPALA
jgi:nucleoside-diphosphate kinase